jgi:hypothetical protein
MTDTEPTTRTAPAADPATPSADTPRRDPWVWRHRSGLWLVVVLAVGWLAVGLHIRAYEPYSPIDEMQHADYTRGILDGEIVVSGDTISAATMEDLACRGVDAPLGEPLPACGAAPHEPGEFPEQGYNTAAIHPPTYYAVMAWGGAGVRWLTGADDVLQTTRLAGGLFLSFGAVALWALLAEFRVRVAVRVAVALLVLLTPLVLVQSATINPDATALGAGAFVLLATVRAERRAWPVWVPAVAAVLAVGLKSTNVVAVVAAGVYLAVRWWAERRGTLDAQPVGEPPIDAPPIDAPPIDAPPIDAPPNVRSGIDTTRDQSAADPARRDEVRIIEPSRPPATSRLWAVFGSLAAGTAVVSIVVSALQRASATMPMSEIPMMVRMQVSALPWNQLPAVVTITPTGTPWVTYALNRPVISLVTLVVTLALPVLAVAALALSAAGDRVRALAVAGLVATLLTGPLFVVANYVLTGIYTPIPSRYALAAVPAMAVAGAMVLDRNRLGRVLASVVAGVGTLAVIAGLLAP